MDRDRQHPGLVPEDRLDTVAVVDVDVHVGDPFGPLTEEPRDRDGRIVVDTEAARTGGHRVMEAARGVEGVEHIAAPDGAGCLHGGTRDQGAGLVHPVEDRVVSRAVAEPGPVALLSAARGLRRLEVLLRMDQPEGVVGRRLAGEHLHTVEPVQARGGDQIPCEEHPVRPERMTGAMVVDPRLRAPDESGIAAHGTERTAATVRSSRREASSSESESGGPSTTRSPFVPSTCPVEEYRSSPDSRAASRMRSAALSARRNGSFVSRSRTSSIPISRPRPRTSPTAGASASSVRSPSRRRAPSSRLRSTRPAFSSPRTARPAAAPSAIVGPRESVDEPRAAGDRLVHPTRCRGEPERDVAARGSLPRREDVRPDVPMVHPEPSPRPAEAGHHFVRDQHHVVSPTDLRDRRPVVVGRDRRAERGTGDRLRDERRDRVFAVGGDHLLQLRGLPRPAPVWMLGVLAAELVSGRDVEEPAEPGRVGLAEWRLPRGVQGAERVPVVRAPPSDHDRAPTSALREVVGARHLHGSLHGLGAPRHRVDPRVVHRQDAGDLLRVGLDRPGRERSRMDILRPLQLLADRGDHRRHAVADVHDDRAAGAVQVARAVGVGDPGAVRGHGRRQVTGRPREHVAHVGQATSCRCGRGRAPHGGAGARPRWAEASRRDSGATRGSHAMFARTSSSRTPGCIVCSVISPVSPSKA